MPSFHAARAVSACGAGAVSTGGVATGGTGAGDVGSLVAGAWVATTTGAAALAVGCAGFSCGAGAGTLAWSESVFGNGVATTAGTTRADALSGRAGASCAGRRPEADALSSR